MPGVRATKHSRNAPWKGPSSAPESHGLGRARRYDRRVATATAQSSAPPVPKGPVAYRRSIRRLGPLMALLPPAVLLAFGLVIRSLWPCEGLECVAPSLVFYGFALLAVPTAIPAGLPLMASALTIALALVSSVLVWMFIGRWAARKATESPVATWRDWWVELATVTIGMWAGVIGGLVITAFIVSG